MTQTEWVLCNRTSQSKNIIHANSNEFKCSNARLSVLRCDRAWSHALWLIVRNCVKRQLSQPKWFWLELLAVMLQMQIRLLSAHSPSGRIKRLCASAVAWLRNFQYCASSHCILLIALGLIFMCYTWLIGQQMYYYYNNNQVYIHTY